MISQCRSKHSCKISGFNERHHTLLHREISARNSVTLTKNDVNTQTLNMSNAPPITGSLPPNTANSGTPGASVNDQNPFNNTENVSTLLKIVPVIIKNGNKSVKTNVLLDSGSDVTLIYKDLASKLNLSGDSKVLNKCNSISEVSKVECKPVEFQTLSVCNSFQNLDINAFVVDTINVQPNSFKISSLKNNYPYLKDINFPILNSSNVDLLIGINNADLLLQRDLIKGETNEPLAIKTCLGWMLMGVYSNSSNREKAESCNHITNMSNESLEIERFWKIESYGIFLKLDPIYCPLLNNRLYKF